MDIYSSKLVQDIMDVVNFFKFKRSIKKEMKNPNSKFNKLGMNRNFIGNVVYVQINCSDTELMSFDYNVNRMMTAKIKPYVDYLSGELLWGEYLESMVNVFEDEEGNPSLSYGVLFIYTPLSINTKRIIGWVLGLGVIAAGIITLCKVL